MRSHVTIFIFSILFALTSFGRTLPQNYSELIFKKTINTDTNHFSKENIQSQKFIEIKSQEWSACHQKKTVSPFLEARTNETITDFLGGVKPIDRLDEMQVRSLQQGVAKQQPWSGDYWAIAKGVLGNRYLDSDFLANFDWHSKYQFVQAHSVLSILEKSGQDAVHKLSPSEKYDLIVGDTTSALTKLMWDEGKRYYDQSGNVEGWMGICHGWSPAAIIEPRPKRSLDVLSFDRKWQIHLVPSEIKGLASYSWANNNFQTESLGQRCDKKNPKRDSNGRLTDPECFDLNPATWHLAIVNQMGRMGKSFVMDATYDYQVWNQPVLQYSYSYFNVETKVHTDNLQDATVAKVDFNSDKFKKYRPVDVASFVGITMKVAYVVESTADDAEVDGPENDIINWVQYDYDLELNKDNKIIGGEWYQTVHPDFIWTPAASERPMAPLDRSISLTQWQDSAPVSTIPKSWSDAALRSSNDGYILNTITQAFIQKASH